MKKQRRILLASAALFGAIGLVLVSTSGLAAPEGASLGDVTWPPDGDRSPPALADLAETALDPDRPAVRLGVGPVEEFRVDRTDATTSNVTITIGGQNGGTYEQTIEHESAPQNDRNASLDTLEVIPSGLPQVVRVTADPPTDQVRVFVTAPPHAFLVSNEAPPSEQAERVAERIDLAGSAEDVEWQLQRDTSLVSLFGDTAACLDNGQSECSDVQFDLACEDCFVLERTVTPAPGESLSADGDLPVGSPLLNKTWFSFDGEGRLIGVYANLHLDVNESAFVAPANARSQVVDAVNERGYAIDASHGHGLDSASLDLSVRGDGAQPQEAFYRWLADADNRQNDSEPIQKVEVLQNAITGEVLEMSFRGPTSQTAEDAPSADEEADDGEASEEDPVGSPAADTVPGLGTPGVMAVVTAVAALGLARARGTRGRG
jgi:hypothetical protein